MKDQMAQAIMCAFVSSNVSDSNLEPANLVDVMNDIAKVLWKISELYAQDLELRKESEAERLGGAKPAQAEQPVLLVKDDDIPF